MQRDDADDRLADLPVPRRRCPVCGKPAAARARPFCSPRCADIDLGRWLNGRYRIASSDSDDDSDTGGDDGTAEER